MSVSVCLACCNGERFIEKQIASILSQLDESDEIIVVDDCSSDRTPNILESFGDRLVVVRNEKRLGVYRNFEKALSLSKNEYIFLADQDDIWEPNKVRMLCRLLENSDIVSSDCTLIDSEDNTLGVRYSDIRSPQVTLVGNFWKVGHLGCCMAFNRDVLAFCMPFPDDETYLTHDMWILLSGLWVGKFSWESNPLIKYRRHSSNASLGGGKTENSMYKIALIRLHLLKHLVFRTISRWL